MPGRHRLLTLGGHALPSLFETLHNLIAGTTGSGKLTLIEEILDVVVERGDRAVICDANGGYMRQFAKTGDRLLNPFDTRSELWSIFGEMRSDNGAERLACSVIPAGHGDSAPWHHYVQSLLAETLRALARSGDMTTERLLHWCTSYTSKNQIAASCFWTATAPCTSTMAVAPPCMRRRGRRASAS